MNSVITLFTSKSLQKASGLMPEASLMNIPVSRSKIIYRHIVTHTEGFTGIDPSLGFSTIIL